MTYRQNFKEKLFQFSHVESTFMFEVSVTAAFFENAHQRIQTILQPRPVRSIPLQKRNRAPITTDEWQLCSVEKVQDLSLTFFRILNLVQAFSESLIFGTVLPFPKSET